LALLPFSFSAENPQLNSYLFFQFTFTVRQHRQATNRYVQGYETASKREFVISIAFGLISQPIKFRFSSLQTTAVVPEPK